MQYSEQFEKIKDRKMQREIGYIDVFNGLYTSAGIVEELFKPIIIKANGPRREDRMFT